MITDKQLIKHFKDRCIKCGHKTIIFRYYKTLFTRKEGLLKKCIGCEFSWKAECFDAIIRKRNKKE